MSDPHRGKGFRRFVTDSTLSVHQCVGLSDLFLTEKPEKLGNLSYCVLNHWKVDSNKDQRTLESWQVHFVFKGNKNGVQQDVPGG